MNPALDPLAALRGQHLPPPVSWWPPAPGWWALLILSALLAWYVTRWFRRTAGRREALRELQRVEAAGLAPARLVREITVILKRYALSCYPRARVAGLSGEAWLQFLDECDRRGLALFTRGPGRVLGESAFRPDVEVDVAALCRAARLWLKHSS